MPSSETTSPPCWCAIGSQVTRKRSSRTWIGYVHHYDVGRVLIRQRHRRAPIRRVGPKSIGVGAEIRLAAEGFSSFHIFLHTHVAADTPPVDFSTGII